MSHSHLLPGAKKVILVVFVKKSIHSQVLEVKFFEISMRGFLLPCLALLLAKASAVAKDDKQRVVNGEDALEGLYPWVVALDAT